MLLRAANIINNMILNWNKSYIHRLLRHGEIIFMYGIRIVKFNIVNNIHKSVISIGYVLSTS